MIAETCSCGASIRVEYDHDGQERLVKTWRTEHIHEMPAAAAPTLPENRDNDTLVEHAGQPKFIGFRPQED